MIMCRLLLTQSSLSSSSSGVFLPEHGCLHVLHDVTVSAMPLYTEADIVLSEFECSRRSQVCHARWL